MNLSMLFTHYYGVLQKHKKQLQSFQVDLDKLNEARKSLVSNKDTFTYSFSNIRLVVPKKSRPSHSIPRDVGDIEVILSIEDDIVLNRLKPNHIGDPLKKLEKFNIILNSDKYTSSWHLDRHDRKENEAASNSVHPVYHLTFGGHYMENLQNDDGDAFGRALIVRTPRIMHPPMELMLGLDFIFSHFILKDELDLLVDPAYISIINELKKNIWMPFALAMAKNYCDNIEINGERCRFDDSFVASVLSC